MKHPIMVLGMSIIFSFFLGCQDDRQSNREESQVSQLPSLSITKKIINNQKNSTYRKVDSTDVDSIKSDPIPLLYAYYTANDHTSEGLLRWYISATGGALDGYIFSLGEIETINGTEKVSWREVSNDAASVKLVDEKVVIDNIADNPTHTFLDWGLGVEKNYDSIQEDIELIRNSTVNVRWWFFQAPNDAWYIIDKADHIYKFETQDGEYNWQAVDTSSFDMEFYMSGSTKMIKPLVAPILDNSSLAVEENASTGDQLTGAVVVHYDGGRPVTTMTLSGIGSENFEISATGEVTVKAGATLDYETRTEYNLTAYATNSIGDGESISVHIAVNNVTDTVATLADTTINTNENRAVDSTIGNVTIVDSGDGAITSMTLGGTNANHFSIEANGVVKIATALDYETTPKYNLTVKATNGAGDSQEVELNITINNIAEIVPTLEDATFTVDENITVGAKIGTISITEIGDSLISGITLTGTGSGDFEVSTDGNITVRLALDYETLTEYNLTAIATNEAGNSLGSKVDITIVDDTNEVVATTVVVSGKITYDRVYDKTTGLDYENTAIKPARYVTVQAIDNSDAIIAQTSTNNDGNYSITVDKDTDIKIRVLAEMLKTGSPEWNVTVLDNTNSDGLYAMQGTSSSTGTADSIRNIHAPSGWDSDSTEYTTTRVAAPFAILDSIHQSMEKILGANANAKFPYLPIHWSIDNRAVSGDKSVGEITTSHYTDTGLWILGKADADSDEYDDHVMIHEWGHYFEDKFSRSDSIGGSHGGGDRSDIRLAFGEGWGNALSAIATDDPLYLDTWGDDQATAGGMNMETATHNNPGWYSEGSIQRILYDLYDSNSEDAFDDIGLGFTPIYEVMVGAEKTTPALTSIFTFITALKDANGGVATEIDNIVANEDIASITDIYGTGRTNDADNEQTTPLYTDLSNSGDSINVCSTNAFGGTNKLAFRRFVTYTHTTNNIEVNISISNGADANPFIRLQRYDNTLGIQSYVFYAGSISGGIPSGDYIIEVLDANGQDLSCFDVKATSK